MALKNDYWIRDRANQGMIAPFVPQLIRADGDRRLFSFGLGSYGYDIRLSPSDFRIFRRRPGEVVNPKAFRSDWHLEAAELHEDEWGQYFILPGHSYGLGVAEERLDIPSNITVLCIGKSSYARAGVIANLTPAEAGWKGHLTLEFSNSSPADVRLYANEGCVQLLFFEGEPCETSYNDRQGKYQDQPKAVVVPRT